MITTKIKKYMRGLRNNGIIHFICIFFEANKIYKELERLTVLAYIGMCDKLHFDLAANLDDAMTKSGDDK